MNSRLVQSLVISAVKRAYGSLIPGNVWPVAVLMLAVPPARVDANIHPTKREVRFSAERKILDLLVRTWSRRRHDDADLLDLPAGPDEDAQISLSDLLLRHQPIRYPGSVAAAPVSRQVCETPLPEYGPRLVPGSCRPGYRRVPMKHEGMSGFALFWIGQVSRTGIASDKTGALFLIDQHSP